MSTLPGSPPQPRPSATTVKRLLLSTGREDCTVYFYPSLFQLVRCRSNVGERVELGYAGSRLLERLLREPGEVVSREELISHGWSGRVVGEGSLNQQIYSLRQIFCDERGREIIQTLPRRGYLFNPGYVIELQEEVVPQPPEEVRTRTPDTAPIRNAAHRGKMLASGALVSVLGVATLSLVSFGTDRSRSLLAHEAHVGALQVRFLSHDQSTLDRLVGESGELVARFATLAGKAHLLTIDRHGGYYAVHCHHPDSSVKWLVFHENQLSQLTGEQLQQCIS